VGSPRPHKMSSGDEFLDLLLTGQERTNDLLDRILTRLPEPSAASVEPGQVSIREPLPEHPQPPPERHDETEAGPGGPASVVPPQPKARKAPAKRAAKTTTAKEA